MCVVVRFAVWVSVLGASFVADGVRAGLWVGLVDQVGAGVLVTVAVLVGTVEMVGE